MAWNRWLLGALALNGIAHADASILEKGIVKLFGK